MTTRGEEKDNGIQYATLLEVQNVFHTNYK